MQQIILRADQSQLKSGVYGGWAAGHRNMLAVLPTGGGKSVVVSDIVLDCNNAGMRQVVCAHRNELVGQMSHHIARRGIYHRVIAAGKTVKQIIASHYEEYGQSFVHPDAYCSVAGVDTLVARSEDEDYIKWGMLQDQWTIDEAHHVLKANKWGRVVNMFGRARGLGVTASPARPDGQGLGAFQPDGSLGDGVFHDMVIGPDMRWLINMGALSDYEIVCPPSDLEIDDGAITDGGDFSPKKLKAAAEKSRIVGDVVREYAKYALFKRAICFATDVETANKIAKQFNDAGIRAASVSAKTPDNVREKYIKDFKNGKIYVLVNVDLFDEGFDVPACEVVIMARPTASLVKYLQMFGRALRVLPGKAYGLIIDHVNNWQRHGLPDKPRAWSLARRDKRGKQEKDPEDIDLTRCMNFAGGCGKPYEKFRSCCPHCGWKPPLPEPGTGGRTVEMVDGDLILLDRATLEAKRKAMTIETAESVAQRVAKGAGFAGAGKHAAEKQIEKIAAHSQLAHEIAQWAAIQRAKGRDDSESYRRFYLTTGVDVMEALNAERSRQDFEEMAAKVQGWYHHV